MSDLCLRFGSGLKVRFIRLTARWQDEGGGMTIFGLFIFATMAMLSGIAIDTSNLIMMRTQMQATADTVAHAALYNRDSKSANDAKTAALAAGEALMPPSRFGSVIKESDIVFVTWDYASQKFTAVPTSRSAVVVTASRIAERANPIRTFLLRFAGFDSFDIRVQAVAVTYRPTCFREGFVANGVVDLQSNNNFTNGFCIHSNDHVELNSNNTFQTGTIVSMPDTTKIDLPNSGWVTNIGLSEALREGAYRMRLVAQLEQVMTGLRTLDSRYTPSYITNVTVNSVTLSKITATSLPQNRVSQVNCGGSGKVSVDGGITLSNMVILTNCEVSFGSGTILDNVIIATTNTGSNSVNGASGVQLGRNDNCADGGDAQVLTLGSARFPADLKVYGSQIIARQNIGFAANANGIQGASMIAGGRIDGTSNMDMGFCGTGLTNNFEAEYFRLAR
jgi:Flp pilus assembly protein TadG